MHPNSLERAIRQVARASAWIGGAMLLVCAILVTIEVVLRKLFVVSVGGANEYSGYALAVGASWAFAYTLLNRGHIRIDVVHRYLPRRFRLALDLLSILCLAAFMTVLAWHAANVLLSSIRLGATSNTPISTPLWIPQSLWVIGLTGFWLVSIYVLFRVGRSIASGNYLQAERLGGIGGFREELEDELSDSSPMRKNGQ